MTWRISSLISFVCFTFISIKSSTPWKFSISKNHSLTLLLWMASILATKPTPHASCSKWGRYNPGLEFMTDFILVYERVKEKSNLKYLHLNFKYDQSKDKFFTEKKQEQFFTDPNRKNDWNIKLQKVKNHGFGSMRGTRQRF